MNKVNYDIIYLICEFLDFLSIIRFRCVSKYVHFLQIQNFFNIGVNYLNSLNDVILLNYPFITHLDASHNPNITNVNHLKKLITLDASGITCGINNLGIKDLNLKKLDISNNTNIYNINHMQDSLIELHACYNSIDDFGISKLNNIQKLNVYHNKNIKNINHMTKLYELNASGNIFFTKKY
jgi:hypothetical protein